MDAHIDRTHDTYLGIPRRLGFLSDDRERFALSDRGSFWLRACEDCLSIDYISRLWGTSNREPWPEAVVL